MNPTTNKATGLNQTLLNNKVTKAIIVIGCIVAGAYILGGTFHAMTFMVSAFRGLMKALSA